MWDMHLHSTFSSDGKATPEEQIRRAIDLGLDGICFTDHCDYDYPENPDGTPSLNWELEIPSYREKILACKYEYIGELEVCCGIELGLQPHLADRLKTLMRNTPFDFVIGSSHLAHRRDVYFPQYYEGRSEQEAYGEYFASILENLEVFEDFDVYGHLDYVVRYGPNRNANYSYAAYADILDEILKKLVWLGKGLELNTAGFKFGLGHPHPTEDILKRYRELGGEIITTGSDAHESRHLGYDFDKAAAILKDCGFQYYTVFRDRNPAFLKL
ncbi:MAG: histidinol-phosphatase HisJ family protein [Lachnospiraceae bacterium]|nr:histidinol-phosphatase HisJ family protein [Lachnospiraceae bacterium]